MSASILIYSFYYNYSLPKGDGDALIVVAAIEVGVIAGL